MIFGAILMLMMIFLPQGVFIGVRNLVERHLLRPGSAAAAKEGDRGAA
jgi:hypothetical protein